MSAPIFSTAPQTNPFGLTNIGASASPTFADIDGDGDLDAFIGTASDGILFFKNTGSRFAPNFVTEVGIGLVDPGAYAKPAFVDIDGDGDLDAFVGTQDGTIRYYQNIGSKAVPDFSEEAANFGLTNVGAYASPTFADIDGDGDMDAFVGINDGSVLFFRNTGSVSAPNFSSQADNFNLPNATSTDFATPTFADMDGDGDLDAFVGGPLDPVFFRNVGNVNEANFVSQTSNFSIAGIGQYSHPSFADIDGDGDLDAFVGNITGDTLFFRNDQAGVKITPSSGNNTVTEGGATDTYTIVLNRQPTANVTITLDNTNNQVNTDKITLTFTAANWNVAQTVTLSAANDTTGEGRHTSAIKHTVTSADTDYNGLAVKPLTVTILDNDLPKVANPSFVLAATPTGLSNNGIPVASFADIDGDGDIDVFIGGTDGNTILFRNTGIVFAQFC
ncbi:MAG: VCBS repeat-containing protein [Methylococcaceae bacterium]|nr:VCBS repeat-containing protein [Methylococcaceae bacterium]